MCLCVIPLFFCRGRERKRNFYEHHPPAEEETHYVSLGPYSLSLSLSLSLYKSSSSASPPVSPADSLICVSKLGKQLVCWVLWMRHPGSQISDELSDLYRLWEVGGEEEVSNE